ncbi:MAG: MFS transporter [Steroidobacteraceae bacterium]
MTSAQHTDPIADSAMRKAFWRILPLIALAYLCAYTDRVNIGFAAAKMNADLGFSATVYGLGAGLFFLGYALFEIPSNLLCARFGPRKWIARIMITWGLLSAGMMFVATPTQFYVVRFLLGVAEAGFYPGVIYYFSGWFPPHFRGRAVSRFFVAGPVTSIVLGVVSVWLLDLHGLAGLKGWQWLFLVQGLPSVLVGLLVLFLLPDRPDEVGWLRADEKDWIRQELEREQLRIGPPARHGTLAALRNPRVLQVGLIGFMLIGIISTVVLSAPLVLAAGTALAPREVGWVISLGGAIGVVVIIWSGNVADPRNARFQDSLVYSMLMAGALLVLASSTTAAVTLAAYLVFAACCFTVPSLNSSAWADVLHERELAVGSAAINTLAQTGAFVMPFAWGALKDATGDYRAGLYMLGAVALAMCALLQWFCRQLPRPAPRRAALSPPA